MEQSLYEPSLITCGLETVFAGIIIGDDRMAEETNGRVTLAVLAAELRAQTKLLETYHEDECDWRDKMDERVRRLETESAAREMRWRDHEKEHSLLHNSTPQNRKTPTEPMSAAGIQSKIGKDTAGTTDILTWRYVLLVALLGAAGGSAVIDILTKLLFK